MNKKVKPYTFWLFAILAMVNAGQGRADQQGIDCRNQCSDNGRQCSNDVRNTNCLDIQNACEQKCNNEQQDRTGVPVSG